MKKYFFETIDSTNEESKRILLRNGNNDFIVVAGSQDSGKGRLGRSWKSPARKGLYVTYVLNLKNKIKQLSILTGLSLVSSIKEICGGDVQIKWPNDLFFKNKKLAGILVEEHKGMTLIGIGLNFYKSAERVETATSLEDFVLEIDSNYDSLKDEFVNSILKNLQKTFSMEVDSISKMFFERSIHKQGEKLSFLRDDEPTMAELVGLGIDGELIVKLENGKISALLSEEVSIRQP